MKTIKSILILLAMLLPITATAAEVPRESPPCYVTEESITVAERFVGDILDEVINGMGYADARAKSNAIIFEAWLNHQTGGYSYGELTDIANNAIWQYRDMYLRPEFYSGNVDRVKAIITPVIEDYVSGKIDYNTAAKNARICIYQSINPRFNPDEQFALDTCYQDIPSVDSSLFTIARRLLIESK